MTPQSYSIDDDLMAARGKRPLVIRVDEVSAISPLTEEPHPISPNAFTTAVDIVQNDSWRTDRLLNTILVERTNPKDFHIWSDSVPQSTKILLSTSMPSHSSRSFRSPPKHSNIRKPNMQLPSFESLGISSSQAHTPTSTYTGQPSDANLVSNLDQTASSSTTSDDRPLFRTLSLQFDISPTTGRLVGPAGVEPPLTPPEDADTWKWNVNTRTDRLPGTQQLPASTENGASNASRSYFAQTSNARPSNIQLPENTSATIDTRNEPLWLERACGSLVDILKESGSPQQIQMIVQCLPTQSKCEEQRPVFEKLVETIQTQMSSVPYITITHAVSQVCTMEEVPASPPATPNTSHTGDEYFDDTTIFTHAAVVPTYHIRPHQPPTSAPRPTNLIAAPSSIQITTLERYIPPTSSTEVRDFFHLSRKSYLTDRLMELSAANGSMLFVYPTKKGATTFANRYLGPIMEPFLRQFMMLNNLYIDVASSLGRMEALSAMPDFQEMTSLIRAMCENLERRNTTRGLPSTYQVVSAETTEVILDRSTWIDWFIEQEQTRIRQDVINYHKSGGRMPSRSSRFEVTPSMLAREVLDGIRQSREPAGGEGIEVGVFVIRRVMT